MEFHCIARSGGAQRRRLDRAAFGGECCCGGRITVVQVVGIREINRIFEVTDRLGIHREAVHAPLPGPPSGFSARFVMSSRCE